MQFETPYENGTWYSLPVPEGIRPDEFRKTDGTQHLASKVGFIAPAGAVQWRLLSEDQLSPIEVTIDVQPVALGRLLPNGGMPESEVDFWNRR